jgi:hypothetical protein
MSGTTAGTIVKKSVGWSLYIAMIPANCMSVPPYAHTLGASSRGILRSAVGIAHAMARGLIPMAKF